MDASIIIAGAAIGGNILLGVGLAATWVRNGRSSAAKYGELKNEVGNMGSAITGLTKAVQDMDNKQDKFQLDTVGAISAYKARLDGHDVELKHINDNIEHRAS